jgi:hypothetical protein
MVVNNLDFASVSIVPNKTDAPLIVDADAELTLPIPFQTFQAVSRQCRQSSDIRSGIEDVQFAKCRALDRLEPAHCFPAKQPLGIRAAEGPDHNLKVYCFSFHVKQYTQLERHLPLAVAFAILRQNSNLDGRLGCVRSL